VDEHPRGGGRIKKSLVLAIALTGSYTNAKQKIENLKTKEEKRGSTSRLCRKEGMRSFSRKEKGGHDPEMPLRGSWGSAEGGLLILPNNRKNALTLKT